MIRYFARHATVANLLMLIFLVAGLLTVRSLRRETFPYFSDPEVEIVVAYPGASAEEVESAICQRIEAAIDGVDQQIEVRSEAREGVGRVVVQMQDDGDYQRFLGDLRTEVDAIDDFPAAAEEPIVSALGQDEAVVSIAVSGPMSALDLKLYCEALKARLQQLDEVSQVSIEGFSQRQLRVAVKAAVLQQHELSVSDLSRLIGQQSVDLPIGTLETAESDLLIRFTDERRTERELRDLIVLSTPAGAAIRLGDLAEVTEIYELDEQQIRFDGERAGLLHITKSRREDTLNIYDAVAAFVGREQAQSPPGIRLTVTRNVSEIVRDRLQMLAGNGVQGLLLVFATMWLFFRLRLSFWVVMGLPTCFLGGLFLMQHLGLTINMMTMVALLLALGLLMDDAIVIAENIAAHLQRGKSATAAVIDGIDEVKIGVIGSFVTTAVVFLPLMYLDGRIGKVLEAVPKVLVLVLAISLIEAFFILPHHLAHSLGRVDMTRRSRFHRGVDWVLGFLRERLLGPFVEWAIRWRYFTAGLVAMSFLLAVGLLAGGILKFQAFPSIDGDVVEARLIMPQGTPLDRTEAIVNQLTAGLDAVNAQFVPRQPDGQALVRHVTVQYSRNVDAGTEGPHLATISVDLLDAETRDGTVDDIVAAWREAIGPVPDAERLAFAEPSLGPAGRAIEWRLLHPDLTQAKAASQRVQTWLGSYAGALDIGDDLRPGKPELRLRLRPGARELGLTAEGIAAQLRAAFRGRTATEFQADTEAYEIDVRLTAADRGSRDDLLSFQVIAPDGAQVPLPNLVYIDDGRGYSRIARLDGERAVTVTADVDTRYGNVREITGAFARELWPELERDFPGLRLRIEGESEQATQTAGSMRRALLIGLIGIFILLSFQFRSYVEPLIVMVAIPLALIGVVAGHLLMGLNLCMPSMLGFVSLAGIVVNDSILLVEFIKLRRHQGSDLHAAVAQASRDRLRPILLTSLTTIAGLLPLLAEKSLQAQVLIPLAVSIVFGLLASTVLVLVVIPCLYIILDDFHLVHREGEAVAKGSGATQVGG